MSECPVCSRESASGTDLCEYHLAAFNRLHDAFKDWEKALSIGWEEYLISLAHAQGLGSWVREIIQYLTPEGAPSEP